MCINRKRSSKVLYLNVPWKIDIDNPIIPISPSQTTKLPVLVAPWLSCAFYVVTIVPLKIPPCAVPKLTYSASGEVSIPSAISG